VQIAADPAFHEARQLGPVFVTEGSDFAHTFAIDQLQPATTYYVKVTAHATADGPASAALEGRFATAPPADVWQDVRFAVMSCQMFRDRDDPGGFRIYPAMRRLGVAFYCATGDNVYYDSDPPLATTVAAARFHWQRMYGQPLLVEFHRFVPGYWQKDDHDSLKNDDWPAQHPVPDEPLTGELTFAKGVRIFREQVPVPNPTYRTIRWGRALQLWLVEGRDFRSPNHQPDGPDKTIWGPEQKAWLKQTLAASDATFKILVSPTPIVGPDRSNKGDNHANAAFATEGREFRQWLRQSGLKQVFVCNGDRHWQYHSVDPETGLQEFSCGAASDAHAGGSPGYDPEYHRFHRVQGGFLSVEVTRPDGQPTLVFRHHDVDGQVVYTYRVVAN
jgi:alkaline phosphatase D